MDGKIYTVGDYWLAKRRDGKSPDIWQIATYSEKSRSVIYRSTKRRTLEEAKAVIHAHVNDQLAKRPQAVEDAALLPQLFLYWREHGANTIKPDVIAGSLRAFIGFLMHEKCEGMTVAEITPALISRFIKWRSGIHGYDVPWGDKTFTHRSQGVRGESIKRNIEDLRAALNHAANNQRIPFVPKFPSVPKTMRSPARDTVLTIEEMGAIMGYMSMEKPVWRWVCLMMGTAARPDACLAFDPATQWRGDLLDIHPKAWPRTKKQNPVIPMIEPLRPIMKDWKADPHKPARSRRTAWRHMRNALGLPAEVVPKTIRHTLATLLRARRVPQEEVSALLGHSYANRTTAVYAKYDPDYLAIAMGVLTKIYEEIVAASDQWHADHLRTKDGNDPWKVIDRKAAKT